MTIQKDQGEGKGSTLFKIAKKKKKHRLLAGDVYISIFFHIFVKKFYQKSPILIAVTSQLSKAMHLSRSTFPKYTPSESLEIYNSPHLPSPAQQRRHILPFYICHFYLNWDK